MLIGAVGEEETSKDHLGTFEIGISQHLKLCTAQAQILFLKALMARFYMEHSVPF